MEVSPEQGVSAWVEYLRSMGVYDLYRRDPLSFKVSDEVLEGLRSVRRESRPEQMSGFPARGTAHQDSRDASTPEAGRVPVRGPGQAVKAVPSMGSSRPAEPVRSYFGPANDEETGGLPGAGPRGLSASRELPPELAAPMPKPNPLDTSMPAQAEVAPGARAAALEQLRGEIGDCTRCPLAYAGRHTIVFGEGDPNAALMFVGEGPGADEDESGRPFVGKAGQLLSNMIGAMGLQREGVYIANGVKCRPPGNRTR